jgi:site-specific DNA-methyltransferase (adenine-specific)
VTVIFHGDARAVLASIPAGIFDCCIADPPYGDTSLQWDRKVTGWVSEVARVLKPDASVWVFGSMRFLVTIVAEFYANRFIYAQDVVWEKQNGTGFHADRFRRVHEHAVMFYRGRWATVYHDTQYTFDAVARTTRRKTSPSHTGHIEAGRYVSHDGGPRLMRSVLPIRNMHGSARHPTQKPEGVIEPLLLYSCPPGGLVLDPFLGSGTTAVVAAKHGRECWGIELNAEYIELAKERLSELDAPVIYRL